ncbi:uncharacterized protein V1516DRAFT_670058 [Lipomyces oligophaga]|uniref:uncharacterized protein n=1 Tax=Lipomyces oligophaga TaxID=45792 RepID=UPI0034CEBED7
MALTWPDITAIESNGIRSQRDLTLNVSMDGIVSPAINLNTVLLEPLNYTYNVFSELSNLADRGIQRFFLNLYWNQLLEAFQLCPFEYSAEIQDASNAVFRANNRTYACNLTLSFAEFLGDIVRDQWIEPTDNNLEAQVIIITLHLLPARSGELISHSDFESSSVSLTSSSSISGLEVSSKINSAIYALTSRTTATAGTVSTVIHDDSQTTSISTLSASSLQPQHTDSVTQVNKQESLSKQISIVLSNYVYTRQQLDLDRDTPHITWNSTGSSSKGWPLLENMIFHGFYRIVFSFGNIELDSDIYNTAKDVQVIFPASDIPWAGKTTVTYSTAFSASQKTSLLSPVCKIQTGSGLVHVASSGANVAPSFLLAADTSDNRFSASVLTQYMKCGFNPVLNATLSNADPETLALDIVDYLHTNLVVGRWAWSTNEPIQISSTDETHGSVSGVLYRCASLSSSGFTVSNCYDKFYVACRVSKRPYSWVLSQKKSNYFSASSACSGNSLLSIPRTPLQNSVLQSIRSQAVGSASIWVDLNSLSVPNCWVTGGPGATCTYESSDTRESREIVIPTVAAIIVAVILALMLCSRLLGTRRLKNRSIRRRAIKKFDDAEYDGVPL